MDMVDFPPLLNFCPQWVPHLLKRNFFWKLGYLLFLLFSMVFLGEVDFADELKGEIYNEAPYYNSGMDSSV